MPTSPPAEQSLSPSLLDLTTLQNVKDWLQIKASADDNLIQGAITALGYYFLWRTGLGSQNGVNTSSPLSNIVSYNETYDGNGSDRLYLRNRPIQNPPALSPLVLTVNGNVIAQSTSYPIPGWVIDADGKSLQ